MNKLRLKNKIQSIKVQPVNPSQQDPQITEVNWQVYPERVGDWVCYSWSNLNFSFRKICNRCKLSREESDNQHISIQSNVMSEADPMVWFPLSSIPHNFQYLMLKSKLSFNNAKLIICKLLKSNWAKI